MSVQQYRTPDMKCDRPNYGVIKNYYFYRTDNIVIGRDFGPPWRPGDEFGIRSGADEVYYAAHAAVSPVPCDLFGAGSPHAPLIVIISARAR